MEVSICRFQSPTGNSARVKNSVRCRVSQVMESSVTECTAVPLLDTSSLPSCWK